MARERVAHIDIAAGIMILWMMLGHINAKQIFLSTPDIYVFLSNFFFFFMPWFFYKSGMFFVPQKGRMMGEGKLLKPFAIWSMIGYIIYIFVQMLLRTSSLYHSLLILPLKFALFQNLVLCNKPLWFLLTLFVVMNVFNVTIQKINPMLLSLICILIGYALNKLNTEYIPDLIANSATGLCFFSAGYWIKDKESNIWLIIVAFVSLCFSIILLHSPYVDIRLNICPYDRSGYDYLLWFPASLSGIVVFNAVCRMSYKFYSFPILRYIGRNAVILYVSHYVILYLITEIFKKYFAYIEWSIYPLMIFVFLQIIIFVVVKKMDLKF